MFRTTLILITAVAAVASMPAQAAAKPTQSTAPRNVHGVEGDPISDIIGRHFEAADAADAAERTALEFRRVLAQSERRDRKKPTVATRR